MNENGPRCGRQLAEEDVDPRASFWLVRNWTGSMDDLAAVPLDHLEWVHRGDGDSFDLVAGDRTVASLEWERGTETSASVRSRRGSWGLKRRGFLTPTVVLRNAETDGELAVLHVRWRDSVLQLTGGLSYRWVDSGFWAPRWRFTDQEGQDVVRFEPRQGHGRQLERGVVSCAPGVAGDDTLLTLLAVGWYFIVLVWAEQEGESIGALVTTIASG